MRVEHIDTESRTVKAQTYHLLAGHMTGQYLGACLNSCRWGGETTIQYELGVKELVQFIDSWIKQNPENFQELWCLDRGEIVQLPYVHHDRCPEEKKYNSFGKRIHEHTIKDYGGRLRCAEFHYHYDNEEIKKDKPKPIVHQCYAIISERGTVLPLETIIKRLNLESFLEPILMMPHCNNKTIFPFDGHTLALYVQAWYNQEPREKVRLYEE